MSPQPLDNQMETVEEEFCRYREGHPQHNPVKLTVTKEAYTNFKVGDKSYHSGNVDGFIIVNDPAKFNDGHHFLVLKTVINN